MAYGKIKADAIIYDDSGSDVEKTIASLASAASTASPTFTGTVTIPTPSSGDNSTKAASTAFVVAGFTGKPASAGTVGASEVVQVDANKDITGFRNITLAGDLTVNGTTTTVNSTNTTITDNLLELNSGASSNANDSGIIIERGSTGDNAIFAWDESADKFIVGTTTGTASSTGDITITAGTLVANLEGASSLVQVTAENSTAATVYPAFVGNGATATGNLDISTDTGFTYNPSTGELTVTKFTDSKGDVRNVPQNTQGSAYTLVAADAGKHILASGTITVPDSVFSAGDAVTIVNNTASDLTITKTITTMYLGTDASSTDRTLATRGTATILFASGTVAYISGAGLS